MPQGSCLCGAVRYEVQGPLRHVTHCHCSMCRKQHGAAFATYAPVRRERFRLVSGADAITRFASSSTVTREFCSRCGSSLFWSSSERPDVVSIALGTLDDDPVGRPEAHIFVGSRAPWVTIEDDLPQWNEAPS